MTATVCFEEVMRNVQATRTESETESRSETRACELSELVRGCDQHLIAEMTPVVRHQSISLDMKSVQRIDAAGIAALISLYRIAQEAGNCFSVSNVAPHVAELLALVGLDGILMSHNAKPSSRCGRRLAQSAA
jgi:anti-anti-sigma factor